MDDGRRMREFTYGSELVCPECGRKFYCYNMGEWAYKRETSNHQRKTFCSWGCMRKFDKRKEQMIEEGKSKRKGRA